MDNAYELYQNMILTYKNMCINNNDDSFYSFVEAAAAFAALDEPNPFIDTTCTLNASTRPSGDRCVITSVVNDYEPR